MLLEFFNELKNNFMAVCQIRNVVNCNVGALKLNVTPSFLKWEKKSSIIPSGC